jgi:acetyl esterase/lipase
MMPAATIGREDPTGGHMDQFNQMAQPSARSIPDDIAEKLQALGRGIEQKALQGTRAIYLPLLKQVKWPEITVHRDLPFGPDQERNLLDVHVPANLKGKAPVVAFFHGGGMIGGSKLDETGLIYANVANYFASHGIIGVNSTYRVAPAHPYPAGGEDVGATVAWLRAHIADYGGDPERIFIMGHSAGAAHVATYAFRTFLHPAEGPGIAGTILLSGTYTIDTKNPAPNRVAYYGADASKYAERQILGNVERADFPVFIGVAELDPIATARLGFDLVSDIVNRHKRVPRFKQVLGHNHYSETNSLGTGDTSLGPDLIDFVENGR